MNDTITRPETYDPTPFRLYGGLAFDQQTDTRASNMSPTDIPGGWYGRFRWEPRDRGLSQTQRDALESAQIFGYVYTAYGAGAGIWSGGPGIEGYSATTIQSLLGRGLLESLDRDEADAHRKQHNLPVYFGVYRLTRKELRP